MQQNKTFRQFFQRDLKKKRAKTLYLCYVGSTVLDNVFKTEMGLNAPTDYRRCWAIVCYCQRTRA